MVKLTQIDFIQSIQSETLTLPLIALPGVSPRIVTGRKKPAATPDAFLATLEIGEIIDEGVLLPVHGEKMAAAR